MSPTESECCGGGGEWVEAEKTDIQKCFVNIKLSLSIYVLGLRIYFLIQHNPPKPFSKHSWSSNNFTFVCSYSCRYLGINIML